MRSIVCHKSRFSTTITRWKAGHLCIIELLNIALVGWPLDFVSTSKNCDVDSYQTRTSEAQELPSSIWQEVLQAARTKVVSKTMATNALEFWFCFISTFSCCSKQENTCFITISSFWGAIPSCPWNSFSGTPAESRRHFVRGLPGNTWKSGWKSQLNLWFVLITGWSKQIDWYYWKN